MTVFLKETSFDLKGRNKSVLTCGIIKQIRQMTRLNFAKARVKLRMNLIQS